MIRSVSPQRPDDVLAEAEETSPADVHARVDRARAAGLGWAELSGPARSAALASAADAVAADAAQLTDLIVREVGKPRTEARGEVARAVGILRYYSQQALAAQGDVLPAATATSTEWTRSRPRGVAGLITPWNFPVAIPMWKAAPALAYGNAAVLKPASAALAVARRLADVCNTALPDGVLTVVPGERETAEALIDNVDVVSFTGSTAVGQSVIARAATRAVPCQAEMGGANVSVIAPSADTAAAARDIVNAAYGYAGQKCTATSHILVIGELDHAIKTLVDAVEAVPVGDPDDDAVVSGPLIDPAAARRCTDAWEEAERGGARLLAQAGERDDGSWEPLRLVTDVPAHCRLNTEEVFGPIATVRSVADLSEAAAFVKASRYGLVSALYTADLDEAMTFPRIVGTGMVKINAPTTGVDYWAPFGGDAASSYGPREQGTAAAALYTSTQTVSIGSLR